MLNAKKILLVLLMGITGLVFAEADGPDYFQVSGVADNDTLNIRSEANAHAKKIGEIPSQSNCVKNLGCKGGLSMVEFMSLSKEKQTTAKKDYPSWCQIDYKGTTGWVSQRYLIEGDCNVSEKKSQSDTYNIEGYEIVTGLERVGGDYYKDFATDVADCARWCSREKRCKGFDYHKELEACWVKEKIYPMRSNPNVIAGIKK